MNLEESGLHREVFEYAYKGYLRLLGEHKITKSNIITICDFSQSSRNRRLYVVDLECRQILINTYVAHGRRSGVSMRIHFQISGVLTKAAWVFMLPN